MMPMWNSKPEYYELSKGKISKNKNIVVSVCSKGGFTIAQQLEVSDQNATVAVFLKGALHVNDLSGLENMRDAFTEAIEKVRGGSTVGDDGIDWDEV